MFELGVAQSPKKACEHSVVFMEKCFQFLGSKSVFGSACFFVVDYFTFPWIACNR